MTAKKPSRARAEIIELVRAMCDSGTLGDATRVKITAQQATAKAVKQ